MPMLDVVRTCRWCRVGKSWSGFSPMCDQCYLKLHGGKAVDRVAQRHLWFVALDNMPAMAVYKQNGVLVRRGRAVALRMCLGYRCYSQTGRSNAQAAVYNAMKRAQVPKGQARQNLLRALAGPHGGTVARVRLIQLGQADRFRHWP